MYNLSLDKIAEIIEAQLIGNAGDLEPVGASIDTRSLKPGEIFFAFEGDRTDGHDYLHQAYAGGAIAAVVSYVPDNPPESGLPLLVVPEPEKALQALALAQRDIFSGPLIAITGSTGKTTTKDILASLLIQKGDILSTVGNYNNQLGLPLTLLALEKKHWAVVCEMGMGGLGEIDLLAQISRPSYAIVTNIGHAHQEVLGSQKKIAQAKAEVFSYLPITGGIVLNKQDQAILKPWLSDLNCPITWIDYVPPADLWVEDIVPNYQNYGYGFQICANGEKIPVALNIPGKHNIINSLAAVGIARRLGLSWEEIKTGLNKVDLTPMRLEISQLEEQKITIINDAYNANPASMFSALDVLETVAAKQRKIVILGDMYELGEYSHQGHLEVGEKVESVTPAYLITVGSLARQIAEGARKAGMSKEQISSFANNEEVLVYLKSILRPGDVILIKGSRGVQLEKIVEQIPLLVSF